MFVDDLTKQQQKKTNAIPFSPLVMQWTSHVSNNDDGDVQCFGRFFFISKLINIGQYFDKL